MSDLEKDNGTERAELVQRLELMERMIAEGRRFTMRAGWIFVLWGLVDCVGYGWHSLQAHSQFVQTWSWPICLGTGAVITLIGRTMQNRREGISKSRQCRSVEAVWGIMGITLAVYIASAMASHFSWQYSYVAGMMMILGMAHGISSVLLRWRVQGAVAAIWWAGGAAVLFCNSRRAMNDIFLLEMCLGMIAFGLYVMLLEHRQKAVRKNA
jgi:hypothetical protein